MNKGVHHVQQHGFRTMPDKREVCDKSSAGRREYKQRREDAWDRDKGICILCERFVPLEQATVEHIRTKGLGGGKHDDRLDNLAVSHWYGNNARGSRALEAYLALPVDVRIKNCQGIA